MRQWTGRLCGLCFALFLMLGGSNALAQTYDAQVAAAWLEAFAASLSQMAPLNDPAQTADPARAGQVLLEYAFGTVLAARADAPRAAELLEIDLRTDQVADCRGVRVGMRMEAALDGERPGPSSTQLYVLGTQESGCGWSWAYTDGAEVYGVEYITYGGEALTEYTLTYVLSGGVITAIRMRMAPATQAQALEGLHTAEEIASRQAGEVWAMPNGETAFAGADVQVMGGGALGVSVADFVARVGEPLDVQTLADGRGRLLVYDGAVVQLNLDTYTGVEVVRGVSVSSAAFSGPRRLTVGMSVQEAAALFRCDNEVSSLGGVLYLEGEALGEPPCGELVCEASGEGVLRYTCVMDDGRVAVLEAGVSESQIAYWRLFDQQEESDGL